jgi:Flp pilus assembly protein TadD
MLGGGAPAGSFVALQQLARSFGERRPAARASALRELACELGAVAVRLCLREMGGPDPARRAWAADLLACLAEEAGLRARIVTALGALAAAPHLDDAGKVTVLALLVELGAPAAAPAFHDPLAVHRRSLGELAALLTRPADVARAADLLIAQLDGEGLLEVVEELTRAAPTRAVHLIDELRIRTDLPPELRGELVRVGAPLRLVESEPLTAPPRRRLRLALLRRAEPDGGSRTVVVALRRDPRGVDARCLCLLVDPEGRLAEGLYRDDADPAAIEAELMAPLAAEGYQAGPRARPAAVRDLLIRAARRTVAAGGGLPRAYFLGRDLLDLGAAHCAGEAARPPELATLLLDRAVDLVAAGEPERARPLLERSLELRPDDAEAAASLGLCLLAAGDLAGAADHLERACRLEPDWPLHHWNLAAIAHRQGRPAACHRALGAYLAASGRRPPARGDDAARVAIAERHIAAHERRTRLEHPDRAPALARATGRARRPRRRAAPGSAPRGRRSRAAPRPRRRSPATSPRRHTGPTRSR